MDRELQEALERLQSVNSRMDELAALVQDQCAAHIAAGEESMRQLREVVLND